MATALKDRIETVVLTAPSDFDSLESEWDQLHACSDCSVFQSHPWLRVWWRHFGEPFPNRELHLVVIRRSGTLIAIGAFYLESKKISRFASTRKLVFIGEGISDYGDIILRPGHEEAGLRAMARHIGKLWRKIDGIHLLHLPEDSPAKRHFPDMLREAGVMVSLDQSDTCPGLELRGTWNKTLASLDGEKRRQLLKRCRQLSAACDMQFEIVDDANTLDQALADFIGMHQQRMDEVGKTGVFSHYGIEPFIREACAGFMARGWLLLSFLKIGGQRVAATCSYLLNRRVSFHIAGFGDSGEMRKYSPGIVLHALCMQDAIKRGANTYDFLRGTEEYKYRLGAMDRPVWGIRASRTRAKVKMIACAASMAHAMLDMIRNNDFDGQSPCGF